MFLFLLPNVVVKQRRTNDDEIENLLERMIKLLFVCYLLGEEIRTIKMYVDIWSSDWRTSEDEHGWEKRKLEI